MALLGRVQQVEVVYQETLESDLLDTAISTRGRLVYEAPDRIRRISTQNEGFVLEGDTMQLVADGKVVEELSVSSIAPLEAMVTALRATFAGDLGRLTSAYRLDYQSDDTSWRLALAPREAGLLMVFLRIEMVGNGSTITSILIEEPDGDRRILRMRPLTSTLHRPD
jgi:hypothetical protein